MGEKAEYLSGLGDGAIDVALADLDTLYGGSTATDRYQDARIMDWYTEPTIRGAYSYPSPGSTDARAALAASVGDTLFFAVEATHTEGQFATVHGAIETAERAVGEVHEALG